MVVLDLLLQLFDDASVLYLSLHEALLDDAYLFIQPHALLLPVLHLGCQVLASLVVIIGGHLVLAAGCEGCGLGGFAFLGGGRSGLLGLEGAVVVEHLCELWGVGD